MDDRKLNRDIHPRVCFQLAGRVHPDLQYTFPITAFIRSSSDVSRSSPSTWRTLRQGLERCQTGQMTHCTESWVPFEQVVLYEDRREYQGDQLVLTITSDP